MSASLPVRSLLAATAAMLLLSACSTAYYTGDTISGPAQRMKRDADGNLPEQVTDHSWDPSYIPVWEERWGRVAQPLLWSHAMYLTLADALGLLSSDDDAH